MSSTGSPKTAHGRSGWTCPGCKNKFFGLNATKAKAHILRLGGFSVLPCHSWRDIDQKKLELLAELHYKKEKESDAKKQKKEQDAAGIEAANTSAGNLLSASARRSSGSIGSAGGGAASRLPYTPPAISAFSSQTPSALTMAIADFIHAEGLPFQLSESPRLALIIKLAKSAPIGYKPPHRARWRAGRRRRRRGGRRPQPPIRPPGRRAASNTNIGPTDVRRMRGSA